MEKLEKIIKNLLYNAFEITDAGGFVEVTLSLPERSIAELEEAITWQKNQPLKLFVVEDNPDEATFLGEIFTDSCQALERINRHISRRLAKKQVPQIVLLISPKATVEITLSGVENLADHGVTRSFVARELAGRTENLVEQRKNLRKRYIPKVALEPSAVAVSSTDQRFLQRVLAIMEENLSNTDFDVEFLRRALGKSRMQLHRKFKLLTGQSPGKFIQTFRLKRSVMLLDQHAGNISEIAFSVGFNSLTYFTKCFRETYGKTPSEYLARKEPAVSHS